MQGCLTTDGRGAFRRTDYEDEKGRLYRKKQQDVLYARYETHDERPTHNVDNEAWEQQQV